MAEGRQEPNLVKRMFELKHTHQFVGLEPQEREQLLKAADKAIQDFREATYQGEEIRDIIERYEGFKRKLQKTNVPALRKALDSDGDGKLTQADVNKLNVRDKFSMALLDMDGDGRVHRDELNKIFSEGEEAAKAAMIRKINAQAAKPVLEHDPATYVQAAPTPALPAGDKNTAIGV